MGAEGIGERIRRKEDQRFITGTGRYTDDITERDTTHAVFLRSPHAHARIRSIDTAAAASMPGVVGVIVGQRQVRPDPCDVGLDTMDEAVGELALIGFRFQPSLLVRVGDEGEFDEHRGHVERLQHGETGLLDLPKPALLGAHQVENAGIALAALRALGQDEAACEAAMTNATWPARMQRLRHGPLIEAAPEAELWLDGGHNPHAARAIAALMAEMPARPTHLICGMLNTKDVTGYMAPLAGVAQSLHAVSIPGQNATLQAEETASAARKAGLAAHQAESVAAALAAITAQDPQARILICGSLYLAGEILKQNG